MQSRYKASQQSHAITSHFYEWDYRLRGYDLWFYPVHPEPVFVPFFDRAYETPEITDDTRSHTFLSGLLAKTVTLLSPKPPQSDIEEGHEEQSEPFEPDLYVPDGEICEFQITLSRDVEYTPQIMLYFFADLRTYQSPLSFELIGTHTHIVVQIAVRDHDASLLEQQLAAFFPEAHVTRQSHYLESCWPLHIYRAHVDFGLNAETGTSLETHEKSFVLDPYVSIFAAMDGLTQGEVCVVQTLLTPVRHNWAGELITAISDVDGTSIFSDAPELVKSTHEKVSSPLMAATLRIAAGADSYDHALAIVRRVGGALMGSPHLHKNNLIPLANDDYPNSVFHDDLIYRLTHRTGMLLSSKELVHFAHLPTKTVTTKKLLRADGHTKESPYIVAGHDFFLGTNIHRGNKKDVTLSQEQRMRHTYVVGASGTGKSTLLHNLITQDIHAGRGCALLDPHGDLTNQVLETIPSHRIKDVIVLDPSDEAFPIGFNIFHARSEAEKILLSSDLVKTFERLSTSWGDRMNAVLSNGILAMLEHPNGGTLLTLRRFLTDKAFRRIFVSEINDPEIRYYWEKEYPLLTGRPEAPVLTRLDTFLRTKTIRNMVSQEKSAIDFSDVMDSGKILLCKLSHGGIGEENSYLLGTLIVTAIYQAALRRQATVHSARAPFYLYIDEFQNFVTPSMEAILSGARKYNLGLILAHQERRQLLSKDREVASSVLSNPYTRICFRMGDEDAYTLAKGLSHFDAKDLQSLGIGQAIVRTEQAQYDFNIDVPWKELADRDVNHVREIIEHSQKAYGAPRTEVESHIYAFYDQQRSSEKLSSPTNRDVKKSDSKPLADADALSSPSVETTAPNKNASQKHLKSQGRGGKEHKYLQNIICKYAQETGLGAEIEKEILGGKGFVDISLSAGKLIIAVEISVTTSIDHEMENVRKCVDAGYEEVFLVAEGHAKIGKLKTALDAEILKPSVNVQVCDAQQLLGHIDTLKSESVKSKTVRGYAVKTRYVEGGDLGAKSGHLAKFIAASMRRK